MGDHPRDRTLVATRLLPRDAVEPDSATIRKNVRITLCGIEAAPLGATP